VGKKNREWQDVEYVRNLFGLKIAEARRNYRSYVAKGISMGNRPDLVGGGLIRSLGGWDEIKKIRLTGQDRVKSDQRILGESDFVNGVLCESEDDLSRKYKLKSLGYDFETVVDKVSSLFNVEKKLIFSRGRQKERVRARDLLCYWCSRQLGIPMADLSKRLGITLAAVSYAVKRGENIATEDDYELEN
jgi:putative transposase